MTKKNSRKKNFFDLNIQFYKSEFFNNSVMCYFKDQSFSCNYHKLEI